MSIFDIADLLYIYLICPSPLLHAGYVRPALAAPIPIWSTKAMEAGGSDEAAGNSSQCRPGCLKQGLPVYQMLLMMHFHTGLHDLKLSM